MALEQAERAGQVAPAQVALAREALAQAVRPGQ
jgi:hypothetical protein